jgi:hypothetical protein
MSTRYTYEQVFTIFESNKCVLLDTKYTNQIQKLNYIATCGHTNSISLKIYLRGNGLKCRQCALGIPTFQMVTKTFSDKGCNVTMTEEEFNTSYTTNKSKINYIALCGHNNIVSYSNFTTLNQAKIKNEKIRVDYL